MVEAQFVRRRLLCRYVSGTCPAPEGRRRWRAARGRFDAKRRWRGEQPGGGIELTARKGILPKLFPQGFRSSDDKVFLALPFASHTSPGGSRVLPHVGGKVDGGAVYRGFCRSAGRATSKSFGRFSSEKRAARGRFTRSATGAAGSPAEKLSQPPAKEICGSVFRKALGRDAPKFFGRSRSLRALRRAVREQCSAQGERQIEGRCASGLVLLPVEQRRSLLGAFLQKSATLRG